MRKLIISILLGLILSMFVMAYADSTQSAIASSLIRLHIVANGDSDAEQAVKLKVRNAVIDRFSDDIAMAEDIDEVRAFLMGNLGEIEKVAEDVLLENGYEYKATASVGEVHFPTKRYENIILPPGKYEALRIVLGEGKGQNWWCVMYPPLCFGTSLGGVMDENGEKMLENSMGKERYALITDSSKVELQVKFKLLEIFDFISK